MSNRYTCNRHEDSPCMSSFWKILFGLNYLVVLVFAWQASLTSEHFFLLAVAGVLLAMFSTFVTGIFTIVFLEPLVPVLSWSYATIRRVLKFCATLIRPARRISTGHK